MAIGNGWYDKNGNGSCKVDAKATMMMAMVGATAM